VLEGPETKRSFLGGKKCLALLEQFPLTSKSEPKADPKAGLKVSPEADPHDIREAFPETDPETARESMRETPFETDFEDEHETAPETGQIALLVRPAGRRTTSSASKHDVCDFAPGSGLNSCAIHSLIDLALRLEESRLSTGNIYPELETRLHLTPSKRSIGLCEQFLKRLQVYGHDSFLGKRRVRTDVRQGNIAHFSLFVNGLL